jgi:hypothetical protein
LMVKLLRAHGGCLGVERRRRAWLAAKSFGEPQAGVDPEIPEWGNPARVIPGDPRAEFIGAGRRTRGTETSQYPEEKKSIEIPQVVASERGSAQTVGACSSGVVGPFWVKPSELSNCHLVKRHGKAGQRR